MPSYLALHPLSIVRILAGSCTVSFQAEVTPAALKDVSSPLDTGIFPIDSDPQLLTPLFSTDACPGGSFCLTKGYCCPTVSDSESFIHLPLFL